MKDTEAEWGNDPVMKISLSCLFALLSCLLISGVACAAEPIGFLSPEMAVPGTELPLLSQPNGSQVGSVTVVEDLGICLRDVKIQGENIVVNNADTWPDGKCAAFTFYKLENQHAQILVKSHPEGLWLKLNGEIKGDAHKLKISPVKWMDDLIRYSLWKVSGYHRYRLRDQPNAQGNVLLTLNKYQHVIKEFTGNVNGSWAEVIIYEVSTIPNSCYSLEEIEKYRIGKEWKGWIKTLGDNGQPKDIIWGGIC